MLGVTVQTRTAPPARSGSTDTDTLFLAGDMGAPRGEVHLVRSLGDFEIVHGARATGNQKAYDYLDNYFREGGRKAYVTSYTPGAGSHAGALLLFGPDLGPGQVANDGTESQTATTFNELDAHSRSVANRFALWDVGNNDTVAAMTTLGGTMPDDSEYGMGVGPWVSIPGPAGVIGAGSRQVPGSSTAAALIARSDLLGNPNRAAAGRDFPLQYANGFVRDIAWADVEPLVNAGINPLITKYGLMQLYGFQTKLPENEDNPFWQANPARARMWAVAQAKVIGENYVFKPIDGRGLLARALQTDLDEMLLGLYNVNGLFGATPQDAFRVEVGASVNTTGTTASGQLRAVMEAVWSLHAKAVIIDLVSIPITGQVSA